MAPFRQICIIGVFLLSQTPASAEPGGKKAPPDTLFEKTIWHKKVSHLVLEETDSFYKVTLLVIEPYPNNYKSENYALYYRYADFQEAFDKLTWLDQFLKNNGILRIHITGSRITHEEILYPAESAPAQ